MKNKSFARKAVMIAGLTVGLAGLSSIFNEAAASGCTNGRPLMSNAQAIVVMAQGLIVVLLAAKPNRGTFIKIFLCF